MGETPYFILYIYKYLIILYISLPANIINNLTRIHISMKLDYVYIEVLNKSININALEERIMLKR
jgi:hypothetical protein